MDGETVIEHIQTDAATTVAETVAAQVATNDAVIASEVAIVSEQVAEHAATSEERHEQILEGQIECQDADNEILSSLRRLEAENLEIRSSLTTAREQLQSILERVIPPVSLSSTPLPSEPEPTPVIVVEEPASAVDDLPAVAEPPRKNRLRKI